MAAKRTRASHIPHVVKTRGAVKEAKTRYQEAEARKRLSPNLLSPADIRGEYDASRVLYTTLGGEIRPLNDADIQAFKDNIAAVGRHYKKGLTAQKIINLSREVDRERANEQIHYAIPSSVNRGMIRFITNAGPNSDVKRHYVMVNILDYVELSSSPGEPNKLAAKMQKQSPLQIWCDCAHFRYTFSYIATIGGVNAGPPEVHYPKLKNPTLTGIGCKHILRTMHEFQRSNQIKTVLERMIRRAQSDAERQSETIKQEEAEKIAKTQGRTQRDVTVKHPVRTDLHPLRAKLKEKYAKQKAEKPIKDAEQARYDAERNLRKLKALGAISDKDFKQIIATLSKKG